MVTLARPPSATAIVAMGRAIHSLCRPRPTTPGAGVWPATPASVTLYGLLIALARRGQDKPLVGLSMGSAVPTDYTWLDLAKTPLLPRASREDTQEDTRRRPWRRAFGG
jgi:hypothetical protein